MVNGFKNFVAVFVFVYFWIIFVKSTHNVAYANFSGADTFANRKNFLDTDLRVQNDFHNFRFAFFSHCSSPFQSSWWPRTCSE